MDFLFETPQPSYLKEYEKWAEGGRSLCVHSYQHLATGHCYLVTSRASSVGQPLRTLLAQAFWGVIAILFGQDCGLVWGLNQKGEDVFQMAHVIGARCLSLIISKGCCTTCNWLYPGWAMQGRVRNCVQDESYCLLLCLHDGTRIPLVFHVLFVINGRFWKAVSPYIACSTRAD